MSDSITINPGQVSVSLDLRRTTALAGCTRVDSAPSGHIIFEKQWPHLSSGEELLWRVLSWLNGGRDLPDAEDLAAGLDSANLAAVNAVLAAEGVTA